MLLGFEQLLTAILTVLGILLPSIHLPTIFPDHRQHGHVIQHRQMGRSRQLHRRLRSTTIWNVLLAEHVGCS